MFFDLGCVLDAVVQSCPYMLRCQMCHGLVCLFACVRAGLRLSARVVCGFYVLSCIYVNVAQQPMTRTCK
jgi:hypothetical protein